MNTELKAELVKLGSTNPELRPHIRQLLKQASTQEYKIYAGFGLVDDISKFLFSLGVRGQSKNMDTITVSLTTDQVKSLAEWLPTVDVNQNVSINMDRGPMEKVVWDPKHHVNKLASEKQASLQTQNIIVAAKALAELAKTGDGDSTEIRALYELLKSIRIYMVKDLGHPKAGGHMGTLMYYWEDYLNT